jgi:hypothetical protein
MKPLCHGNRDYSRAISVMSKAGEASMTDTHQPAAQDSEQQVKLLFVVEDDADIGEVLISTIQEVTFYRAVLFTDGFQALKGRANTDPSSFCSRLSAGRDEWD